MMKIKNDKVTGERCTTTTSAGPECKDGAIPKIFKKISSNSWNECRNSCDENDDCGYFKWKVKYEIFINEIKCLYKYFFTGP